MISYSRTTFLIYNAFWSVLYLITCARKPCFYIPNKIVLHVYIFSLNLLLNLDSLNVSYLLSSCRVSVFWYLKLISPYLSLVILISCLVRRIMRLTTGRTSLGLPYNLSFLTFSPSVYNLKFTHLLIIHLPL